jgi:hypothetical protein
MDERQQPASQAMSGILRAGAALVDFNPICTALRELKTS